MNWTQRSTQTELLDEDNIPFADLADSLRELNHVNTYLGGHRVTIQGLEALLQPDNYSAQRPVHIAEIGCGGGDNLRVVHHYLLQKNIPHRLTGIDLKPECTTYAAQTSGIDPAVVQWQACSYEQAQWTEAGMPDIIFSSLFSHHFTDAQLIIQLPWLRKNAKRGFFINDLHRHPLAYHSFRLITKLVSKSYLVKNDGPVSVQRSFRKAEWLRLFREAGLPAPRVSWHWAFRYLIISESR